MIEQMQGIWQFLAGQPVDHYLRLLPWHLSALLLGLGLLASLGLHFLIGHLFGFYRRKGRHAQWIAWPTGLVLTAAVVLLLGAYLLGTQAQTLAAFNITDRLEDRLGEMLLAPAFASPELAAQPEGEISLRTLHTALFASPEADYRDRLLAFAEGPPVNGTDSSTTQNTQPQGQGPARGPDPRGHGQSLDRSPVPGLSLTEWRMAQIGLRWVASPHRTWLAPLQPPSGNSTAQPRREGGEGSAEGYFLPEFLLGLVNELPPDAVLPREDWEHVAGTRFVGNYLEPLLVEYLSYLALALTLVVVLILAIYFLLMARLRRIGQPKSGKQAAKSAKEQARSPSAEVPIPASADMPVTAESDSAPSTVAPNTPVPAPVSVTPATQEASAKPGAAEDSTGDGSPATGNSPGTDAPSETTPPPQAQSGDGAIDSGSSGKGFVPKDIPQASTSLWKALSGKFLPGSRRS